MKDILDKLEARRAEAKLGGGKARIEAQVWLASSPGAFQYIRGWARARQGCS